MINTLSLAVHLHLYYIEMWQEIKKYLTSMEGYTYDLYITLTKENISLIEDIKSFHPNVKIWIVENRGYDVGPFIDFLHHIDLDNYDLVMKLHTKGQAKSIALIINGLILDKNLWKDFLIQGIIGDAKLYNKIMAQFQKNPQLGMVGAKLLITDKEETSKVSRSNVNKIMQDFGFAIPQNITFIAGTMFVCRTQLLKQIKDKFTISDFELTDGSKKDGTLAHALERIFGTITLAQGYEIKGFDRNYLLLGKALYNKLCRFIYLNKITHQNHHLIKVCKIPIYNRKQT